MPPISHFTEEENQVLSNLPQAKSGAEAKSNFRDCPFKYYANMPQTLRRIRITRTIA